MGGTNHQRIEHSGASLAEAKNHDQAVAGQTLYELVQLGGIPPPTFLPFHVSSINGVTTL